MPKGQHQWGFYIELWKQNDKIYDYLQGSDDSRIVGDPPAGILEDMQFDSKTGRISFKAELPSRDIAEIRVKIGHSKESNPGVKKPL